VRGTVPPSAEIQANIDKLLSSGLVDDPSRMLSQLARLGARLIIQRAVEEEFDSWLGRARYERRPEAFPGMRNGFRPRHLQTAEGELRIEIPQVREAAEPFVSKLFRKGHTKRLLRTDPLKAMIVGRRRPRRRTSAFHAAMPPPPAIALATARSPGSRAGLARRTIGIATSEHRHRSSPVDEEVWRARSPTARLAVTRSPLLGRRLRCGDFRQSRSVLCLAPGRTPHDAPRSTLWPLSLVGP
jgi:hypothetical protein